MKKAAAMVLVVFVMVVTSVVFATDSEARCTSSVHYQGPLKIVEERCHNRHTGVTRIKETRINERTGRVVVVNKVIDSLGRVTVERSVVRHGRSERHPHWRDSRRAGWDSHRHWR